jgi:hypothetical protein
VSSVVGQKSGFSSLNFVSSFSVSPFNPLIYSSTRIKFDSYPLKLIHRLAMPSSSTNSAIASGNGSKLCVITSDNATQGARL